MDNKPTFLWVRTDAGEALVALPEIAALHWTNNTRETQTRADLILRNGHAYKVYDIPMEPTLHGLGGSGVSVIPLQYVAADDGEDGEGH